MSKSMVLKPRYGYSDNREILKRLGLSASDGETRDGWWFYGSVRVDEGEGGTVDIFGTEMPAQFWRFTIRDDDGKETTIATGSGRLEEYWPTAERFASGMLVVESFSDEA